jgi:hypothetical protein
MLEMKRLRSKTGEKLEAIACEDGGPLERQSGRRFANHPLTPPGSPERGDRPSKFRRHSTKLMKALGSLTNSGR